MSDNKKTGYLEHESKYPYKKQMSSDSYEKELHLLQIELLKWQNYIIDTKQKVILIYEGRDAAGKGGSIKRLIEHLQIRMVNLIALGVPTEIEKTDWYFKRYVLGLPSASQISIYDRSWYNRTGVEPVNNFCSSREHAICLQDIPNFEKMIQKDGTHIVKLWFSVGRKVQKERMKKREKDPLKQHKISAMDPISIELFDEYTRVKQLMFDFTDTDHCKWMVIRGDQKKRARINSIKYILSLFDYPNKDQKLCIPDKKIVGSPSVIYS